MIFAIDRCKLEGGDDDDDRSCHDHDRVTIVEVGLMIVVDVSEGM